MEYRMINPDTGEPEDITATVADMLKLKARRMGYGIHT